VLLTLQALEPLRPEIIAPRATVGTAGYRAYVPHNQYDLVFAALYRGMDTSTEAFRKLSGSVRAEKDFRPVRIETRGDDLPTLHYLYPLDSTTLDHGGLLRAIRPSVRAITHLGWGIDHVVADATLIDRDSSQLTGERWRPSVRAGRRLRVHCNGSLDALMKRHVQFLNRLQGGWTPVSPLSAFDQVRYRRETDPLPHPHAVFKLVDGNDDTVAYSHAKLIHIAGMVRHLAIRAVSSKRLLEKLYPEHDQPRSLFRDGNPPRDLRGREWDGWVDQYVAGHLPRGDESDGRSHAQFSYVPLPSTGHAHTDPAVRRVMIVVPLGDEAWLDHLAECLDGQPLEPLPGTTLPPGTYLQRIPDRLPDGVRDAYTRESRSWASFTPVILPGHDDRKPDKTRKLILKALAQSGIDQPCEFEWGSFSPFPKSYSAHKYVRDESARDGKRPVGYVRPNHLLHQSVVHLRLRFDDPVPGPIIIGAGRHCGFGLLARADPF
jgi:CRISPR-associated protein Csb2